MIKLLIYIALAIFLFVGGMPISAFLGWLFGTDIYLFILLSITAILAVACGYIIKKKEYEKLKLVGPFSMSLIVLSIFFGCRYSDFEAIGDCLFNKYEGLYTKWGKCVISDDIDGYELVAHGPSDGLDYYDLLILPGVENTVCGPYFYRLAKVKVNLENEGEDYTYDDDDKVYYDFREFQIDYTFSIYDSKGEWAGEHTITDDFYYYPKKKEIDGKKYDYQLNYEDLGFWAFRDMLHNSVQSQLHNYILEYGTKSEDVQQSTSAEVKKNESKPIENTQRTPQKHERQVPIQKFHECVGCFGGGLCSYCNGSGTIYFATGPELCAVCGGFGKCSMCAGRGGEYVTEYETIVEYY